MPRPSTGSARNAATFLSAFGEPIVLEDGSTIDAIVRQKTELVYDGSQAIERQHAVLEIPDVLAGSIAQFQRVEVRGVERYIAAAVEKGDGWTVYSLSNTLPT